MIIVPKINKPLFDTYVYVWDKYINDAIKKKTNILISCPKGSAVHDPQIWKKTGHKMKKVFRRPDDPMILYGNYVFAPEPRKQAVQAQLQLF